MRPDVRISYLCRTLAAVTLGLFLCLPCPAPAREPAGRVVAEHTVEGILTLKGPTRKNRCLIAVTSGTKTWIIVADRDALARAFSGENGTPPRSGQRVRVTFVRKHMRMEGIDISANFFRAGEQVGTATEPEGMPTNLGDAFKGKDHLTAHACRGILKDSERSFADVRRACTQRDATRQLILDANGKGSYTPGQGKEPVDITWYPDEFDDGVINILGNGKLHVYAVYDNRYLEGAAGPEDGLPTALKIE